MINHIAVDIGASSGRLVYGTLDQGVLQLKELHRFTNQFHRKGNHDFWDIDHLFNEIIVGLQKAKQEGIDQCTLGIDTWAVDYVLLNNQGERIHEVYAYRDARTNGAPDQFHKLITRKRLYEKTGIQELAFNTIYQLYVHDDKQLEDSSNILFVPDYLYYRLTGKLMNEATNASTSAMISLANSEYDEELLGLLGLSRNQFPSLVEPGLLLGHIRDELQEQYELPKCYCIVVPTHDTASAVVGVPVVGEQPWAFLSSGTWSLLGMELTEPLNNQAAFSANYTNERGAFGTYRFLKNIMGLWMLQEVRRLDPDSHSFADLVKLAEEVEPFTSLVPCNNDRFLNPDNMIWEIQNYCRASHQPVPQSMGEIARCIFDSLALTYRDYMRELTSITGVKPEVLYIVGGGVNNALLCQLSADVIGIEVMAGPSEAAAIGNLAVQLIASQKVESIQAARQVIAKSFEIISYVPSIQRDFTEVIAKWEKVTVQLS